MALWILDRQLIWPSDLSTVQLSLNYPMKTSRHTAKNEERLGAGFDSMHFNFSLHDKIGHDDLPNRPVLLADSSAPSL